MSKVGNFTSGQGKNDRASAAYTAVREQCGDIFNAAMEHKDGFYG
jgi:hypothetical protein